ncbi:Crp/Fnr family transcriptional regulator [Methylobacterium radiodurans]|uniref:Crp/Fnr family transcriptional regulator n=1 Tax=Methylobacterium radiodurans TaxID=2202828 RepID=A0A2U8VVC7_9HYPH|nr:Crp/Fnr family transcriptional regulator [Methylobacterium radiodurans]AWN37655.1 Crp/Fnr family transcriptional regulator [Methylobacterium radiodurans]
MPNPANDHALALLVRKLDSIAGLSDKERQAILRLPATTKVLQPKQDIVRDGDRPSRCCLVLEGWACRYKLLSEGRRQILSFHIPGDVPDLQSLHIHSMDHSLCAATKAVVAFIPHDALRDLINRFPNVATVLWRDTLIDAAVFRQWMTGMGRRSAYARMAHLFCEMYLKLEAVSLAGEHRCPLPLTQTDLADALGLTSVHVNRTLKELRGSGLLTLRGSTLVVDRWDELVQAAEFDPTYLHLEQRAAE